MLYFMFYFRGYSLHGLYLARFSREPHGYIRLFSKDAEWLNKHFLDIGTEIIVTR